MKYHDERNLDGIVDLFTDDARILVTFRPIAQGKAAIREIFRHAFDEFDERSLQVETTHVDICGDTAFCIGTYKTNLISPSGKRVDDEGKWLVILRRAGKTWKIVTYCSNTDLPIHRQSW